MAKKNKFEDLLEESLENAREDRKKTQKAFERVESIISAETDEDIQKMMLVGEKVVKLLEQLTRSNEQIVRLAQLKERSEGKQSDGKRELFDVEALEEEYGEEVKDLKIRVK